MSNTIFSMNDFLLGPPAPEVPRVAPVNHEVQFYEDDAVLLDGLARTIGSALGAGDSAIVIATKSHRNGLIRRLQSRALDLARTAQQGRFVELDAAETLSKFMVNDWPDAARFQSVVGSVVTRANAVALGARGYVTAFGEMVALLWKQGRPEAAIRLEQLWNELARTHAFYLHCAYPLADFSSDAHASAFRKICAEHSHVIPGESYTSAINDAERSRVVSLLQQKAQAFQTIAKEKERLAKVIAIHDQDLNTLHRIFAGLNRQFDSEQIVSTVLSAVTELHQTSMGLLHLIEGGHLRVAASVGFSAESLKLSETESLAVGDACLQSRKRIIVRDTETDPLFEQCKDAARRAGFRAVHSTPLMDRQGQAVGVLSVYSREPRTPSERELRLTDIYAQFIALAIDLAQKLCRS
jgi:MEDS: MEthanogen/methylotroph, DcmR Sensory domain/GAF domain